MKILKNVIGYVGLSLLVYGQASTWLRMDISGSFYVFGFLISFGVYFPWVLLERLKTSAAIEKVCNVLGLIATLLVSISFVFKMLQWAMVEMLFGVGVFIFLLGYLPLYFYSKTVSETP